jgi:hypothetical protein
MKLPSYIRDLISTRTTAKQLFNDLPEAEARKQATAEVLAETGYKANTIKSKPPSPAPAKHRFRNGLTRQDAMDVYHSLMRPFVGHQPPPSSSSSPVTGEPQIVRRARRSKPSPPPVEPPATKHALPLLYPDGQRNGRGTNINHEFSDSPATQTWRQQNQRE